ncbi:hypothetical protein [Streptomyces sp. 6N223]|uniref:hypothetical protein n=1 Tax=Streptomyces sp. 6N223 TaxID=3457412 RepID=UPI003FD6B184
MGDNVRPIPSSEAITWVIVLAVTIALVTREVGPSVAGVMGAVAPVIATPATLTGRRPFYRPRLPGRLGPQRPSGRQRDTADPGHHESVRRAGGAAGQRRRPHHRLLDQRVRCRRKDDEVPHGPLNQAMRGMLRLEPGNPVAPTRFVTPALVKQAGTSQQALYGTACQSGFKKQWGIG